MFQCVIIVGRLGADPKQYDGKNQTVVKFGVAANYRWAKEEATEWFNVVTFGGLAEACLKSLSKGRLVEVNGFLRTTKWKDNDNRDRCSTDFIAQGVQFLDKPPERERAGDGYEGHRSN